MSEQELPLEPDLNTDDLHQGHVQLVSQSEAVERMLRLLDDPETPREGPGTAPREATPKGSVAGRVARDIGRGVVETPMQAFGGAVEAVGETGSLAREMTNSLAEKIGPLGNMKFTFGSGGVGFVAGEEAREVPSLLEAVTPEVPEAESATGGLVRGVSNFVVGYLGAGKLSAVRALAGGGKAAKAAAPAVRGAIADFTVIDPQEERVSDLLNEFPALQNPVTDYLEAGPDDTEAEGRFKNAIEGLGLGVAMDGFIAAMRVARAARQARAVAPPEVLSPVEQLKKTTEIQRERFTALSGDPEAPAFEIRPVSAEEGAAAVRGAEGAADAPSEIFINWSRIDSNEDVKGLMQQVADASVGRVTGAQRGVRTFEQTKLDAKQIDAWKALRDRPNAKPLNAEESLAVRELWVTSGDRLLELAQRVQAEPGNEIAEMAFRKQLAVHNAIQEQVLAARTETARALSAWRIPAGSTADFAAKMDELSAMALAESRDTRAIAEGLVNLSEKGLKTEADAFAHGAIVAKTAGAIRQLWYFSLLSGPHTHARNIISQVAVIGQQIMERKVANIIGKASGTGAVPDGETMALLFGAVHGFRDAFRLSAKTNSSPFIEAARTGRSGIGVGKIDAPSAGAFDPERLGANRDTVWGRTLSFIDGGTRIPFKALAAADEVFKQMGFRMELDAQAFRQAHREMTGGQITPDQLRSRQAQLMNDPDEELLLAARMNAETVTFTKNPSKDAAVFNAMRTIQKIPGLGRFIMPFTRTAYNLATHSFQRTPLALVTREFRADLAAGGARSDLAMARFGAGSAMMLVVADATMRGKITGEGPANYAERQTLMRTGWRPYSIKFGDTYVSYRGTEPVATLVGLSANIAEILAHEDFDDTNVPIDDVMIATAMSIAQQMTSQQYMSGVSAFFEAMDDPRRNAENFFSRGVGTFFAPTGFAQLNRALLNPIGRESMDALDAIKARTPYFSETLPVKYDLWGRPISFASGFGKLYDLGVPLYGSRDTTEPIDAELLELGAPMGRPKKLVTFDGGIDVNLELHPEAYSRYVQLAGNAGTTDVNGVPIDPTTGLGAKDMLNLLVTGRHPLSASYDMQSGGSDGGKKRMIQHYVRAYRDAAQDRLLVEFPELAAIVRTRSIDASEYGLGLAF